MSIIQGIIWLVHTRQNMLRYHTHNKMRRVCFENRISYNYYPFYVIMLFLLCIFMILFLENRSICIILLFICIFFRIVAIVVKIQSKDNIFYETNLYLYNPIGESHFFIIKNILLLRLIFCGSTRLMTFLTGSWFVDNFCK